MNILVSNNYKGQVLEILKVCVPDGFEVLLLEENTQECFEKLAPEADYILASGRVKITKNVLERASKLKMVQRTGVGLDSIDLAELKRRDIPLYVNQGVNAESVAEHTLLLMLACLRRLSMIHRNTINGIWERQEQGIQTYELAGKTVGLVGMGNIARTVVKLLKSFEVNILYYDLFPLPPEREIDLGISYCKLEDMLPHVDIISLHCPLTDGTRKIINAESLDQIKQGAILINTARGGLIDTDAVVKSLRSGKLSYAGLDVHEEEPLIGEKEIMKLENVILTPHIGGITHDSFYRMMHDAMRNIAKFEEGDLEGISKYLH